MILELCEWNLRDRLDNLETMEERNIYFRRLLSGAQDIAEGMGYLHRCRVIHGDLKSAKYVLEMKICLTKTASGVVYYSYNKMTKTFYHRNRL